MNRWERIWNTPTEGLAETEFFRHVGKTLGGQPLTDSQFQLMIDEVVDRLALSPDDRLLDLCCGNGVLTRALAARCAAVVGVDFSRHLIDAANSYNRPDNVHYRLLSALAVDRSSMANEKPFDKVLLYDALQHFARRDFETLVRQLVGLTTDRRRMLFGGIPDRARRWKFYDTPRKKWLYAIRCMTGHDMLGTWWDRAAILRTCERLGMCAQCLDQSPGMYNAHFRFDAIVWQAAKVPAQG